MRATQAEIDSAIERSQQWTRHREAMQIMGAAIRAPNGRRLDEILTQEQLESITLSTRPTASKRPPTI